MELYYKNLSLDDIVYIDDYGVERTEDWRDIPDYEGLYQVSDLARVKSLSREMNKGKVYFVSKDRILKQHSSSNIYLQVCLSLNKVVKIFRVHSLVAICFLNHKSDIAQKIVVDHKRNNRLNNKLSNLQIISQRKNSSKNQKNKTSKYTGVSLTKQNNYKSQIVHNGKSVYLGTFKTEQEAEKHYQNAVKSIENGEEIIKKREKYSSEHKGVCWCKNKRKWISYININKKRKFIGHFNTEQQAFEAREKITKNLKLTVK